jgi:gamma-glutamylcysteine synthetase
MVASELPFVTSVANAAMPAMVALMGNSAVHSGRAAGVVCAREHGKGESLGHRHGMPAGPVGSPEEFVEQILSCNYLLRPPAAPGVAPELARVPWAEEADGGQRSGGGGFAPFGEHWQPGREQSFGAFVFHDHYVWHSARPRAKQGTIEVRPACQQPHGDACVAAALGLGIVEARDDLAPFLASFNPDRAPAGSTAGSAACRESGDGGDGAFGLRGAWPALLQLHKEAGATGLADARVRAMALGVLERAAGGLAKRGLGEETFLAPLFARVAAKANPAQVAQAALAKGGMWLLVEHLAKRK